MQKSVLSSIMLYAIVQELKELLEGAYIQNIYQSVNDVLLFKFSGAKLEGKKVLLVDHQQRMHLTDFKYPVPKFPTQFCMNIRKYLKKHRVAKVSQHGLDRIALLELFTPDGNPWRFVVEFFGGGNYYVIRPDDSIFLAKRYKILRSRKILAGETYELPRARGVNLFELDKANYEDEILTKGQEIVRVIARDLGVGGLLAEEICKRAGVEKKHKAKELSKEQADALYSTIVEIRRILEAREFKPQVILDEAQEPIEVLPFDFVSFEGANRKYFDTINKAVDEYYGFVDSEQLVELQEKGQVDQLSKEERILQRQREQIARSEEQIKKNQELGDLIYEFFGQLEELIRVVHEAKFIQKHEWREIEQKLARGAKLGIPSAEIFQKFIPSTQEVVVSLKDHKMRLDLKKSVQDNATEYYNRVKKARKKIKGAREAIKRTKKRLKRKKQLKKAQKKEPLGLMRERKKHWYEKFHWFHSSDGFLVIGGRDAQTNDLIYSKHLESTDVVVHTEIQGSPLGVIKNPSNDPAPETTLQEAAEFVAAYSRAWKMAWSGLEVFWVTPEQVSKSPKSGEYLPKGSFIITGRKNILKVDALTLGIGLVLREKSDPVQGINYIEIQVISGPPRSLEGKTDCSLEIIPVKNGSGIGAIAKQIYNLFLHEVQPQQQKWLKRFPLQEIMRVLPRGESEIREKR